MVKYEFINFELIFGILETDFVQNQDFMVKKFSSMLRIKNLINILPLVKG